MADGLTVGRAYPAGFHPTCPPAPPRPPSKGRPVMSGDVKEEIRFLGDLQRLQPQPGDVFVLMVEQAIDAEMADRLRAMASTALNGAKVLVLSDGIRLGCVAASAGSHPIPSSPTAIPQV